MWLTRSRGVCLKFGQSSGEAGDRLACLEARQMHAEAHVRSCGERRMQFCVRTARVKSIGIGKQRLIPIGRRHRQDHQIAVGEGDAG